MANSRQLFEDDEKLGKGYVPDDDAMRQITGVSPDEEAGMDEAGEKGAKEDLADREKQAGKDKTDGSADKKASAGGLDAAESAAGAVEKLGAGFNPAAGVAAGAAMKAFFRRNKRNTAIGGGVIGAIIGIILVMMVSLLPLKLMSITQDLQNKFFAASEQASQKEVNNLFSRYISQKVIPGMHQGNCTSTRINYHCTALASGDTPVGRLYNAWRDAKFENKLADNYGLEIRKEGNQYFMRSPNLDKQVALGAYSGGDTRELDGKVFVALNRTGVRQETYRALDGETKYKRVMYKVKVTGLLERKYGIRWCVTACAGIDKASASIADKKLAFKSYLNKLIIEPQSEMMSLAIDCASSSFNCADPDSWDSDGRATTEFSRDLQDRLVSFRDANGPESLKDLAAKGEDIQNKGVMKVLIEDTLAKVIGPKAATRVIDLTDPIGWIDLLTHVIAGLEQAPQAIRFMRYAAQAEVAVKVFAMYRTTADEIKDGSVDATVIGSMTNSLNSSSDGGGTDQGGVSAEQTPLYSQLIDNSTPGSTKYTCDNGKPIPAGKYVCDEEKLSHSPSWPDNAVAFYRFVESFGTYGSGVPVPSPQSFIDLWNFISNNLTGWATKAVMFLIEHNPADKFLLDYVTSHIQVVSQAILGFVGKIIIPSALTDNPSGGRMFDLAAAGADVSGNDFAHYGQGGQLLSPQQIAQVQSEQQQDAAAQFRSESLFGKVFDSSSSNSVISRVAMSLPASPRAGLNSLVSSFVHLPGTIFGSLLSSRVNAATAQPIADPFGVTQYGYDPSDPVFSQDPQQYWQDHGCDNPDKAQSWGKSGVLNQTTGEYDNSSTNGCALILSAVGSAGAIYNEDVLTSQDQVALNGGDVNTYIAEPGKYAFVKPYVSKNTFGDILTWLSGGDANGN